MQFPTIISAGLFFASSALSKSFNDTNHFHKSHDWKYECGRNNQTASAPTNFKAFNLQGCTAQLTFSKDRYIGVHWAFDAIYPDHDDVITHTPYGNSGHNFGIGDAFHPTAGNNFLTRFPGASNYTSVLEFKNVCNTKGTPPSAWRFYTTSANPACSAPDYRYTTKHISVHKHPAIVTRPRQPASYNLSRLNDAGEFEVKWHGVADIAAYSVIVEYPTGKDKDGKQSFSVRGARVKAGTHSTKVPTTKRQKDVRRRVVVHTVNSQGVWSLSTNATIKYANW